MLLSSTASRQRHLWQRTIPLKILDDPFAEEEYAIAYKKGNDELGQKLDDALTKLKEDGTLDEIVSHWIGDNADQKSYTGRQRRTGRHTGYGD